MTRKCKTFEYFFLSKLVEMQDFSTKKFLAKPLFLNPLQPIL